MLKKISSASCVYTDRDSKYSHCSEKKLYKRLENTVLHETCVHLIVAEVVAEVAPLCEQGDLRCFPPFVQLTFIPVKIFLGVS